MQQISLASKILRSKNIALIKFYPINKGKKFDENISNE